MPNDGGCRGLKRRLQSGYHARADRHLLQRLRRHLPCHPLLHRSARAVARAPRRRSRPEAEVRARPLRHLRAPFLRLPERHRWWRRERPGFGAGVRGVPERAGGGRDGAGTPGLRARVPRPLRRPVAAEALHVPRVPGRRPPAAGAAAADRRCPGRRGDVVNEQGRDGIHVGDAIHVVNASPSPTIRFQEFSSQQV